MYRHGRFSGDPHPGNMMRLADGRIAFLDFGLFKTLARDSVELELACQRATCERDAAELHRLLAGAGFLPEPEKLPPEKLLAYVLDGVGGTRRDKVFELTPELVAPAALQAGDPRSSHFEPSAIRTSTPSTSSAAASSC